MSKKSIRVTPETKDLFTTLKDEYAPESTQDQFTRELLHAYEDRQTSGISALIEELRKREDVVERVKDTHLMMEQVFEQVVIENDD